MSTKEFALFNAAPDLRDQHELDLMLEGALWVMNGPYVEAHDAAPIKAYWVSSEDELKAKVSAGAWPTVFQKNDPSEPDAGGYHTLSGDRPTIVVLTDPVLLNGGSVLGNVSSGDSLAATLVHEFGETRYNPYLSRWHRFNAKAMLAGELGDPLQGVDYWATCKDGTKVKVADLCTPEYFDGDAKPRSRKFSLAGAAEHPYQLLKGGYQAWCKLVKTKESEVFAQLAPPHNHVDIQFCASLSPETIAHKKRKGSRLDRIVRSMQAKNNH